MRQILLTATLALTGCAFVPVQSTTLTKPNGSSVTCKQVGRGFASYSVGKSVYESCLAKAKADGYT